ncbi:MAG: hypothetical protein WC919_06740 [Candidatus Paceibacterota bacterium]|jgi:hypothetical protein
MKKIGVLLVSVLAALMISTPALAAGLNISPLDSFTDNTIELSVPADGSTELKFLINEFQGEGELNISLENIPLQVEPATVPVKKGDTITLTLYGDESLASQTFDGKIRFLAMTGGSVAMGIKIKARIQVEGQPAPEPEKEEIVQPASTEPLVIEPAVIEPPSEEPIEEQSSSDSSTQLLPPAPKPNQISLPIVIAIVAGVAVVCSTVVLLIAKRRRY